MWCAALIVGAGYWAGAIARSGVAFPALAAIPPDLVVVWKAVSTGCLVAAAWLVATSRTGALLAGSVTIIFVADLLLALGQTGAAGGVFIAAHLLSAQAYRRASVGPRRPRFARGLALSVPALALAATMLGGGSAGLVLLIFPLFSALSAATALHSRFPIWLNGLGAGLFCASDVIFVIGAGSPAGPGSLGWLVWFAYFSGLLLIVRGLIVAPQPGRGHAAPH